jgi:two-component sensor histidine kinase
MTTSSDSRQPITASDRALWGIVAGVLRAAPRRIQVAFVVVVLIANLGTAIITALLLDQPNTDNVRRVASLIFGNAGFLLLGIAGLLHQAAERSERAHPVTDQPPIHHGRHLNTVMLALPLLAFKAGCSLSLAVALLIPDLIDPFSVQYAVAAGIQVIFIFVSGRIVRTTTRFLYRHAAQQAEAAARARGEATEAHLSALQAQMNPHFLFNALNTVASLIRTDALTAESTVENLAHVLRRTLDRSRRTVSTVQDEVEYLEAYLSVERQRFGDRLRVEWDITPETQKLAIPPMTLQPLVENALKHGIGSRLEGGTLRISSGLQNGTLVLEVTDDGIGFPTAVREGTGLMNLRDRLRTLYGTKGGLDLERRNGGAHVVVRLPSGDVQSSASAQDMPAPIVR